MCVVRCCGSTNCKRRTHGFSQAFHKTSNSLVDEAPANATLTLLCLLELLVPAGWSQ